jgi:hypothetical protein
MTAPTIIADMKKNVRERVRVSLDQWQGHDLLDIRVTAQLSAGTGIWVPTKKGLSVNVALIPALRQALTKAETKARELGLIGGDA